MQLLKSIKARLRRKAVRALSGDGFIHKICSLGGSPRGLIHVGANTGQEAEYYDRCGLNPVVYIEPIPDVFAQLENSIRPLGKRHTAIQALCSDSDGAIVDFHVASNGGQSSSMLDFGSHADEYPKIGWVNQLRLTTERLDSVLQHWSHRFDPSVFDVLVIDVQGAEMQVLQGAPDLLGRVSWIFTEVSEGGLYKGDCSFDDIYAFLRARGFHLKTMQLNKHRWGDALFGRESEQA